MARVFLLLLPSYIITQVAHGQPYDPLLPPPFPATYQVKYMQQPYDHFNYLTTTSPPPPSPLNYSTWPQLYLYNDTYWKGPPYPIVFYTGAEGAGVEEIWQHSGWIVDVLARNLSALIVFAEHRYFGQSNPYGPVNSFTNDAVHLGLLSLQQSMADYANLITYLRNTLHAWESPLLSVGGSLAGELTTAMRVRYPFLVDMGIAASAPILGYPGLADQYSWYKSVTNTFQRYGGDECVYLIRNGFYLVPLMSLDDITTTFNTCTPADEYTAGFITGLVWNWAGGAAESGYPPLPSTSPVLYQCTKMAGSKDGIEAFVRILTQPDTCLNISNEQEEVLLVGNGGGQQHRRRNRRRIRRQQHKSADSSSSPPSTTSSSSSSYIDTNGWDYLSCTDEVHPIGSNNVTDFFPPSQWSLYNTSLWCEMIYGNALVPRADTIPTQFGYWDMDRFAATTSRLIFSSGNNDPWMTQSVNITLSPSLPAIIIDQGAHHSDLGGPYNPVPSLNDTSSLVQARQFEIDTLNSWVQQSRRERQERNEWRVHKENTEARTFV